MEVVKVLEEIVFNTCVVRKEIVKTPDDQDHEWNAAYSLIDGTYIGDASSAEYYERNGIMPQAHSGNTVASIGFCAKEQFWAGWSHRAQGRFNVGSVVKKGDCAYTPDNVYELFDSVTKKDEFGYSWMEEKDVERISGGIKLSHNMVEYLDEYIITGEIGKATQAATQYQVILVGRGEWTAKTLDDAKQMAIDFATSVS